MNLDPVMSPERQLQKEYGLRRSVIDDKKVSGSKHGICYCCDDCIYIFIINALFSF